jgi:hypothetical protein
MLKTGERRTARTLRGRAISVPQEAGANEGEITNDIFTFSRPSTLPGLDVLFAANSYLVD